jgi:hypothetical protein
MKNMARRIFLLLPLFTLLLLAAMYFALDTWLESAGGRRAVERVLTTQLGMPVGLQGEFNIVLLPAVGVSGTDLVVRDGATGSDLARGGSFRVSLELLPLVREELRINEIVVEDLMFAGQDGANGGFAVQQARVTGFAAGEPAEFSIDLGSWGEVAGEFTWRPQQATVDLAVDWGGFLFPRVSLEAWVHYTESMLQFTRLSADLDGQSVAGAGCFIHSPDNVLNLELAAALIDLDRLGELPDSASGGAEGMPFELNLVLNAGEVRYGETTAFDSVLRIGGVPACP